MTSIRSTKCLNMVLQYILQYVHLASHFNHYRQENNSCIDPFLDASHTAGSLSCLLCYSVFFLFVSGNSILLQSVVDLVFFYVEPRGRTSLISNSYVFEARLYCRARRYFQAWMSTQHWTSQDETRWKNITIVRLLCGMYCCQQCCERAMWFCSCVSRFGMFTFTRAVI